jgi:hypothetical protein
MVMVGAGAAVHLARSGAPWAIPAALGYFSLMELLQVAGYLTVDACTSPENQLLAYLSYLHIVFQPLVINAFAMALVPHEVSRRIAASVYALSALASVIMLVQIYPFTWLPACRPGDALCGAALCVRAGEWHIAWYIPYRHVMDAGSFFGLASLVSFPSYVATVFLLPLVYGSWRFVLFHLLAGPVLANMLTSNPNEAPAIWCLFSIAIIIACLSPRLLIGLEVHRWWLWPRAWTVS